MDRFDAAIIGAGPEGLVAAITLARAGLRVCVLEKESEPGGRAVTREFHPGFRASPYADELPAIAPRLFRELELARHGAILAPSPASTCVSEIGHSVLFADGARAARAVSAQSRVGLISYRREIECLQEAIEGRAAIVTRRARGFSLNPRLGNVRSTPWPAGGWANASLEELLRLRISDPMLRLHLAADATSGRAVSPAFAGTGLHALAPGVGRSGQPPGGMGKLGAALTRVASAAGVFFRCGAEVTNIPLKNTRVRSVVIGGREEIPARVVISALDLKSTVLDLLRWSEVSPELIRRVGHYRQSGQTARVLLALDAPPDLPFAREAPDVALGPIHVVPSFDSLALSHETWSAGALPDAPLVTLRVPSFADPRLAPVGKAVVTATLAAIPSQLHEGSWLNGKRGQLLVTALSAAERVMPGIASRVIASKVIVAPDIEAALGCDDGDLDGGEIAPDQALGFRPFEGVDWQDGRMPIGGLYLGGASSAAAPFLLGASGERAALAVLTDLKKRPPA